jgi:hypothetical protein
MEKEGNSENIISGFFPRSMLILVIVLLFIPSIFVIYSTQFPEKIRVGVVLTNDDLVEEGEIAKRGLNDFHDIFTAKVVDTRFNESDVRVKNGSYLTDDYFDSSFSREIRDIYNVDIVLIITEKLIDNWLGDGMAAWGQADTKSGVALLTISPTHGNESLSENYIIPVSRHEVLHILGYHHPQDYRRCLMEYASLEKELCGEYELVLPYHVALWRLGAGQEPGRATFLIRASFLLLFSPLFVVSIIISQALFKKFIYQKDKIDQNSLVYGIGVLYITLFLAASLVAPVYPQFIILVAVVFLYIILEAMSYEKHLKHENTEIAQ